MTKLSKEQINELKNLGLITSVDSADLLAGNDVDELKYDKYITHTIPSATIEDAVTHGPVVESIQLDSYKWNSDADAPIKPGDNTYSYDTPISIYLLNETPSKPESGDLKYILATILPDDAPKNLTWSISFPEEYKDYIVLNNDVIEIANHGMNTEISISARSDNGIIGSINIAIAYVK